MRSVRRKSRASARSSVCIPGPTTVFATDVAKRERGWAAKAAGLNQCSALCVRGPKIGWPVRWRESDSPRAPCRHWLCRRRRRWSAENRSGFGKRKTGSSCARAHARNANCRSQNAVNKTHCETMLDIACQTFPRRDCCYLAGWKNSNIGERKSGALLRLLAKV